jgi:aspartate kinase
LISKNFTSKASKVEIVTGSDKVTAIEVHDPFMVGEVGFDLGIMEFLKKYNISYILKASNANSITSVIWEDEVYPELINDLKKKYHKVTVKNIALVCALGSNIAQPGILAKAAIALSENKINIDGMSQSLSQVSMQFVIKREDYKKAIIVLNDALCVQ